MFGLLLRPFRTLIVVGIAFVAGFLYAGSRADELCQNAGGEMQSGICYGAKP